MGTGFFSTASERTCSKTAASNANSTIANMQTIPVLNLKVLPLIDAGRALFDSPRDLIRQQHGCQYYRSRNECINQNGFILRMGSLADRTHPVQCR